MQSSTTSRQTGESDLTRRRRRTSASITCTTAIAISLCLTYFSYAEKGGKGNPGDDGGSGGDASPPPILPAPIGYSVTELRWHEDANPDFGGLHVATINRHGVAVGWITRPNGFAHGVVNLGDNGEPTNTMVDLNEIFALSLASMPDWRIAYARVINETGLIGCELIPATAPQQDTFYDTVAKSLAIADLDMRGSGNALTLVDAALIGSRLLVLEMNKHGDLLASASLNHKLLYRNTAAPGNPPNYINIPIDEVTEWRPSFNSSLQIASAINNARQADVQSRYSVESSGIDPSKTVVTWKSGRKANAFTAGIAEDGTTYVRNSPGAVYQIKITEAGETFATPLTEGESALQGWRNKVSRAENPGEEEMVIGDGDPLGDLSLISYQIYKPNYGRFPFPVLPIGWLDNVHTSPPHDPDSGQAYIGGYIIYEDVQDVHRAFILTPEGATPPSIVIGS